SHGFQRVIPFGGGSGATPPHAFRQPAWAMRVQSTPRQPRIPYPPDLSDEATISKGSWGQHR
ncbi:hypothetical protein, partial [Novacetimonas hansenii]|uniref:hypothetical protein n=1 Tax=Novacetimonas hansenii TaxID=436 RepID=UPI0039E736B5